VARRAATQRLVFLVKHLVQCLQSNEMSVGLTSETLKALTTIFPLIKEIYGSHWSDVLDIIKAIWESGEPSDEYLPVLHSSFHLFSCLRSLCTTAESNDDLEEAWNATQKTHPAALVDLLTKFGK
jgi:[phosphatase 2A protein]-leucine-carboxy methyltransferase